MKVKDVMNREPVVAYVPGTVREVLKILAKHDISGVPVLKRGTRQLAGMVTRNDIFKNPDEEQLAMVMNSSPHTVKEDDDIKAAAKVIYENKIHCLPVLDKDNNLAGVVTPDDLLKVIEKTDERYVRDFYTTSCVPIYQETPLPTLMEIISITNESALPVLDDEGRLAGIVTDGDLFKLSHIKESVSKSEFGLGDDEDAWTWEGIRDVLRLYYSTSKIDLPSVPVKEVMVKEVEKVTMKTPISEAAHTMLRKKINQLPVVKSDDRLVGMVTDIGLMRAIYESQR